MLEYEDFDIQEKEFQQNWIRIECEYIFVPCSSHRIQFDFILWHFYHST